MCIHCFLNSLGKYSVLYQPVLPKNIGAFPLDILGHTVWELSMDKVCSFTPVSGSIAYQTSDLRPEIKHDNIIIII